MITLTVYTGQAEMDYTMLYLSRAYGSIVWAERLLRIRKSESKLAVL